MRMAQAILLGSTMLKWVRGVIDSGDGGCALGMANAGGVDWSSQRWINQHLDAQLPCDCDTTKQIMCGGAIMGWFDTRWTKLNTLVHLFNYHVMTTKDWTIEQLCDWVDSVDPAPREVPMEATVEEIIPHEVPVLR